MQNNFKFKTIKELIFSVLENQKKDEIEVEIRFGQLIDITTNSRFYLQTPHPVFLKTDSKSFAFRAGVEKEDFIKILSNYSDIPHTQSKDRLAISNKMRYRYVNGKIVECLKKTRSVTYDIYNPNCEYDMRISISEEKKEVYDKKTKIKIFTERKRNRTSFNFEDFVIDCTEVEKNEQIFYEVEMEIVKEKIDLERFVKMAFRMFSKKIN